MNSVLFWTILLLFLGFVIYFIIRRFKKKFDDLSKSMSESK